MCDHWKKNQNVRFVRMKLVRIFQNSPLGKIINEKHLVEVQLAKQQPNMSVCVYTFEPVWMRENPKEI